MNKPTIVLADEPTGQSRFGTIRRVLALFRAFNRNEGLTVVLVTHEPDVAAACDRIIRMRDGKIREEIRTVEQPRSPAPVDTQPSERELVLSH